jgi:autotransporter-associated beta strand protein
VIGGTGGLVKQGTGVQTLSGANTFSGGLNLAAGGLVLGNGASGALTVSGNGSLDATTALNPGNAINLARR